MLLPLSFVWVFIVLFSLYNLSLVSSSHKSRHLIHSGRKVNSFEPVNLSQQQQVNASSVFNTTISASSHTTITRPFVYLASFVDQHTNITHISNLKLCPSNTISLSTKHSRDHQQHHLQWSPPLPLLSSHNGTNTRATSMSKWLWSGTPSVTSTTSYSVSLPYLNTIPSTISTDLSNSVVQISWSSSSNVPLSPSLSEFTFNITSSLDASQQLKESNTTPYADLTQIAYVPLIFLLLYMLVMISAMVGNLLVCYTVLANRKMHTVVNCYIVNLALCDFLIGAFVLPSKLLEFLAPASWTLLNDSMCTAMSFLQTIVVFASVLTLVATCFER